MAPSAKISYTGPPNFLASDQWIQILTALKAHLPLKNIVYTNGDTTRTIRELDVDFVPLDEVEEERSVVRGSIVDKPLVNLFAFACEDNETYRSTHKKLLKDWQTPQLKRPTSHLVLLVTHSTTSRSTTSRLFSRSGLDKVKADINVDKRNLVVELGWPLNLSVGSATTGTTGGEDGGFGEVVSRLKESLVDAWTRSVSEREEEVRRSESQRTMVGWNFCTYFILKETLATSFDQLGLLEDALVIYEELEEAFSQALREKNLPWFGTLGGTSAGDDSRSILDTSAKSYRDMILNNTITLFDFRIYLFACRMILLAKQQRILDVLSVGIKWVVSFARGLKENERQFTPLFLPSFIYSSVHHLISATDEALSSLRSLQQDSAFLFEYAAKKGELMNLARSQLDKIGIQLGYLPPGFPYSNSSLLTPPSKPVNSKITNPQLLQVLHDKDAFDRLWVETTQRMIEYFAEGKRRKWALRGHAELGGWDLLHGSADQSHSTYASLPPHYSANKHKWPPLESYMLSRSLFVHSQTQLPKDRAWLEQVLCLVGLQAESEERGLAENASAEWRTDRLIGDVRAAADALEEEITKPSFPGFEVRLVDGNARLIGGEDGSLLDIFLVNKWACDVEIDSISLALSAPVDSEGPSYSTTGVLLKPGSNTVTLACHDSHSGVFSLASSTLCLSKVTFAYSHTTPIPAEKPAGSHKKGHSTSLSALGEGTGAGEGGGFVTGLKEKWVVRVPRDQKALSVQMSLPRTIQWDSKPVMQFSLHTGRNLVQSATIAVEGEGVEFKVSEAEAVSNSLGKGTFTTSKESITLGGFTPEQIVKFTVPHSTPSGTVVVAKISIEYESGDDDEGTKKRKLKVVRKVSTSLPVQVSVMDSFRDKTLISKFTISSTSHLQVRIKDTALAGGTGLSILGPKRRGGSTTIVTPQRPAHCLYQLRSQTPRVERETLYLSVWYRTLREEIESRVEKGVRKEVGSAMEKDGGGTDADVDVEEAVERIKERLIERLGKDAGWVQGYMHAGELDLKEGLLVESEGNEMEEEVVKRVLGELKSEREDEEGKEEWHELVIPVDLPFIHILCAIQLRLASDIETIYAGQPVPVRAEITTSFHWGRDKEREYRMRYAVQELVTDWLVGGCKRGDFVAKEDGTHVVDLTLVPLHHGELSLPKIGVSPLAGSGEGGGGGGGGGGSVQESLPNTETYHLHAAQRVLVLPRGGRSTFVVGMSGGM